MTTITGNTYPVKDQIKALGGKWNADRKGWDVPDSKVDQARKLVAGGSTTQQVSTGKCSKCGGKCSAGYSVCFGCSESSKKCRTCGKTEHRDARGYVKGSWVRNGECQDCCEERRMGY